MAVVMAVVMIVPCTVAPAYATTSLAITGGDDVSKGDEFTVQIKFAGEGLYGGEAQIGYDFSALEYVSGGNNEGNEGYVELKKEGGDGSVTFDVTFKAVDKGRTGLDVSTSSVYDYNTNPLDDCALSKVISIKDSEGDSDTDEGDDAVVHETETKAIPYDEEKAKAIDARAKYMKIAIAAGALLVIIIIAAIVKGSKGRKKRSKRSEKSKRRSEKRNSK